MYTDGAPALLTFSYFQPKEGSYRMLFKPTHLMVCVDFEVPITAHECSSASCQLSQAPCGIMQNADTKLSKISYCSLSQCQAHTAKYSQEVLDTVMHCLTYFFRQVIPFELRQVFEGPEVIVVR